MVYTDFYEIQTPELMFDEHQVALPDTQICLAPELNAINWTSELDLTLDYFISDPIKIFLLASNFYQFGISNVLDVSKTLGMFGIASLGDKVKVSHYLGLSKEYSEKADTLQDLAVKIATFGLAFNGVITSAGIIQGAISSTNLLIMAMAPVVTDEYLENVFSTTSGQILLDTVIIPLMVSNGKEMLDSTKELETPLDAHKVLAPIHFGEEPNGLNIDFRSNLLKVLVKLTLTNFGLNKQISSVIGDVAAKLINNYINGVDVIDNLEVTSMVSVAKWFLYYPNFQQYTTDIYQFYALQGLADTTKWLVEHAVYPTFKYLNAWSNSTLAH